jgi:hypothetical protein
MIPIEYIYLPTVVVFGLFTAVAIVYFCAKCDE